MIPFAAAIVGGVVGWFGRGWTQRTAVGGSDNTVASAGRDVTQVGRDQVNISRSSSSEPYVSAVVRGGFVVVVNTSKDLHAENVTWSLDAADSTTRSPFYDLSEPPEGGIVLAPGGEKKIARWGPAFGYQPAVARLSWTGDDGRPRQHGHTLE